MDSCLAENGHPSSQRTFGTPDHLEHNLTHIVDGEGRTVLINEYGEDYFEPSFDRVTKQTFGSSVTEYNYYKIDPMRLPEIAPEDQPYVDPNAKEARLCESSQSCGHGKLGRSVEDWIEVTRGTYLVFQGIGERRQWCDPRDCDPLMGFAVNGSFQGIGVPLVVLSYIGAGRFETVPSVPLATPSLKIHGPTGSFTLQPDASGVLVADDHDYATVDSFLGATQTKHLSLMNTSDGLRVRRNAPLGAAAISVAGACGRAFTVTGESSGALRFSPLESCSGDFETRELARNLDSSPGWFGVLSNPLGQTHISVTGGIGAKGAVAALGAWETSWSADECQYLDPEKPVISEAEYPTIPLAGSACALAVSVRPESYPTDRPLCGQPAANWSGEHLNLSCWLALDERFVIDPHLSFDVLIAPTDPGRMFSCEHQALLSPTVQHANTGLFFEYASVVRDGNGGIWTYYADFEGKIGRAVSHGTSDTWDRSFDRHGRLSAERSAFGDQTCLAYDSSGNLTSRRILPAAGRLAPHKSLQQTFSWGRYARLERTRALKKGIVLVQTHSFTWDNDGNLLTSTGPDGSTTRYHDYDRGRPKTIYRGDNTKILITYDGANGQASSITDNVNGTEQRIVLFRHDAFGRETATIVHGAGEVIKQEFYPDGRLSWVERRHDSSSPMVRVEYGYDNAGVLDSVVRSSPDSPTRTQHITSDERGLPVVIRDESGGVERTTCLRYDARQQLADIVYPNGNKMRLVRNSGGHIERVIRGYWGTQGEWDRACSPTGTYPPFALEETAAFTYGRGGKPTTARIGGVDVSLRYDGFGRLIERAYATEMERFGWAENNTPEWHAVYSKPAPTHPVDIPDARDPALLALSEFRFDDAGRQTLHRQYWWEGSDDGRTFREYGLQERRWTYDTANRTTTITEPTGDVTTVTLDRFGRPVNIDRGGIAETLTWTNLGRRLVHSFPAPVAAGIASTVFDLSDSGQIEQITTPSGQTLMRRDYDALGRLIREESEAGARSFSYDPFDRLDLVNRRDANGNEHPYVDYDYDANGNRTALWDGNSRRTLFTYDTLDRLRTIRYPNKSIEEFEYLPGTDLISVHIDRNGGNKTYSYDGFGKLESVIADNIGASVGWTGVSSTSFVHSLLGLRSAVSSDPRGTVSSSFERDSLGLVTREGSSLFPNEPVMIGNAHGGRLAAIATGTTLLEFDRQPDGRLQALRRNGQAVAQYTYAGMGGPDSVTYGNGLRDLLRYDEQLRPTEVETQYPSTARLRSLFLARHQDGTLAQVEITDQAGNLTSSVFAYDAHRRVVLEGYGLPGNVRGPTPLPNNYFANQVQNAPDWAARTIDNSDNWISVETNDIGVFEPTVRSDNRYAHFVNDIYSDPAGNVTDFGTGVTFLYDGLGRMVRSEDSTGVTTNYAYDGLGRLVSWTDGIDEAHVQYATAVPVRFRHVGGDDTLVAHGDDGLPIALLKPNTTHFAHRSDGSGRIHWLSDEDGLLVESYEWTAFGGVTIRDPSGTVLPSSSVGNRLVAAGGIYFEELGLQRFGHRWFRPEWGRFLSADPLRFADGPNMFAYVGNQPTMFYDPTGLLKKRLQLVGQGSFDVVTGIVEGFSGVSLNPVFGNRLLYEIGVAGGAIGGLYMDLSIIAAGTGVAVGGSGLGFGTSLVSEEAGALVFSGAVAAGAVMITAGAASAAIHTDRYNTALNNILNEMNNSNGGAWGPRSGNASSPPDQSTPSSTRGTPAPSRPRNGHLAGGAHSTGIPFDKNGFPDFSSVAVADVKITPTGNRVLDVKAARKAATDAGFTIPDGYVWHHHQDVGRMQLVPEALHSATGHTGGWSIWGALGGKR